MKRVIWNEELETLSPAEQHTRERDWLGAQLEYVFSNSPFYQRKLREADLSPRQIREPEDLPRLGFTTKEELRESQLRAPPFGDYLAAPKESLSVMHRTSGSTGRFLFTTLTAGDMAQTNECGARAFWAAGLRPRHTVVHCLNYSLWMGGLHRPPQPGGHRRNRRALRRGQLGAATGDRPRGGNRRHLLHPLISACARDRR